MRMRRRDFLKAATCTASFAATSGWSPRLLAADGPNAWELWGVAELRCWFNHLFKVPEDPTGPHAEECLDAHLASGMRHVAWELGRSVLAYHSELPDATCWGLHDDLGNLGEKMELEQMFRERCQLRVALAHAEEKEMVLYGRLCMNRNYHPGFKRSKVHNAHPEWRELSKNGKPDVTRLCYALPEYREERRNILVEAAEIGCHGLYLDFCRQPPFVRYHPAFVDAYREQRGVDPRDLTLADKEAFLDWCRFRAEFVTTFLRELKEALAASPRLAGRQVPLQVKIPNDGLEANLICGLDVERWCAEGLVDELAPNEMNWLAEYQQFDDRPYIELGEQHGLPVYANVSFNVRGGKQRTKDNILNGRNPLVLAERVHRLHQPGLAGMAFYQSDTGVQLPGFPELLPRFASRSGLEQLLADKELKQQWPVRKEHENYGLDHHSLFGKFRGEAGRESIGA